MVWFGHELASWATNQKCKFSRRFDMLRDNQIYKLNYYKGDPFYVSCLSVAS